MTKNRSKTDKLKAIIRARPKALVAFSGGSRLDPAPEGLPRRPRTGERHRRDGRLPDLHARGESARPAASPASSASSMSSSRPTSSPARRFRGQSRPTAVITASASSSAGSRGLAKTLGIDAFYDASNLDDLSDYRPGRRATEELGVVSPLVLAGFTKKDVRTASKKLGLSSWDKPANPCLASRIPYGTPITLENLERIRAGEKFLRAQGFPVVRLRHHGRTWPASRSRPPISPGSSSPPRRGGSRPG